MHNFWGDEQCEKTSVIKDAAMRHALRAPKGRPMNGRGGDHDWGEARVLNGRGRGRWVEPRTGIKPGAGFFGNFKNASKEYFQFFFK